MQVIDENECDEDGIELPFPRSLDFEAGFCSSLPDFQLNGNRMPNYPSYLDSDKCALRLTKDGQKSSIASAYLPLSIADDDFTFSTHIEYRIYGSQSGTADGMAFVMHQDPRGPDALGHGGGSLGVYTTEDSIQDRVKPSLVIEMDSHYNGHLQDSCYDSIHVMIIHENGTAEELAELCRAVRNSASGSGGLWIDYDGNTLSVFHDAYNANTKPFSTIATAQINLSTFFDSSETLYYGFTGATGGQTDNHDVLGFSFSQG